MLLSLGPVPAKEVDAWVRFARRVMCEIRMDPGDLDGVANDDLLQEWAELIGRWESPRDVDPKPKWFRWDCEMSGERAEYLLNGLDRCIRSAMMRERIVREDLEAHRAITLHIVQGFVDGLAAEGPEHQHYVDQVRSSLGVSLDH